MRKKPSAGAYWLATALLLAAVIGGGLWAVNGGLLEKFSDALDGWIYPSPEPREVKPFAPVTESPETAPPEEDVPPEATKPFAGDGKTVLREFSASAYGVSYTVRLRYVEEDASEYVKNLDLSRVAAVTPSGGYVLYHAATGASREPENLAGDIIFDLSPDGERLTALGPGGGAAREFNLADF